MGSDEYESILRKLLEDLRDALQENKASRVIKRLRCAMWEAQAAANEQERREALSR